MDRCYLKSVRYIRSGPFLNTTPDDDNHDTSERKQESMKEMGLKMFCSAREGGRGGAAQERGGEIVQG